MKLTIKNIVLMALMLASAALAAAFMPTARLADVHPRKSLAAEVPHTIGQWKLSPANIAAVLDPTQQAVLEYLYTETYSANYLNADKQLVMLSLAYGKNQSDGNDVHKPDLCYPAQGFTILEEKNFPLVLDSQRTIRVRYLKTQNGPRIEPLIYWTTAGDYVYQGKLEKKMIGLKYSRDNLIPDGLIARVSTFETDTPKAITLLTAYIKDWYGSTPKTERARYFGALNG